MHRSSIPEVARLYLPPVDNQNWLCKILPVDTGFEGMKGSWRAAECWNSKVSGEAIG